MTDLLPDSYEDRMREIVREELAKLRDLTEGCPAIYAPIFLALDAYFDEIMNKDES